MTRSLAIPILAASLLMGMSLSTAAAQPPPNPIGGACGANAANYVVKHNTAQPASQVVPTGKALVYVIEAMPDYPIVTKKVNIGLDGTWLGATDAQTHMSFTVNPGVHHLCAIYQGHAESMDAEGHTLLLHLNAQAGHTYYLRYHALLLKDSPGIAIFELVDDDEGRLLVQSTQNVTSALKK